MNRIERLKLKIAAVQLLKRAKAKHTYREIARMVGLHTTVVSRYVAGHVLPTLDRARQIMNKLDRLVGMSESLQTLVTSHEGYIDNTRVIGNIALLQEAATQAFRLWVGKRITKVLTAAVDGIPLATLVAQAFDVPLVIAKKEKEVGVPAFLEATDVIDGRIVTFYIPKHAINHKDSVLIVDDVIRSGRTQAALCKLVQKAKAEVAGVFTLYTIGEEWKQRLHANPFVQSLCHLEEV